MEIKQEKNGSKLLLSLIGRLDTITAPQLDAVIKNDLAGITDLTIDLAQLEYVSSAGLRMLLTAQKLMNKQGSMVLCNVCQDVMEVFNITGFADILNIK